MSNGKGLKTEEERLKFTNSDYFFSRQSFSLQSPMLFWICDLKFGIYISERYKIT